ncbi:MAG: DUF1697 domain-containing protein [Gemmatimonadota bacterium]
MTTLRSPGPVASRAPPPLDGRAVAFLRAINVGGHTVKMARLRSLFEETGVVDVATFIASGNVVFGGGDPGPALEARIERHLFEALGYDVATFIRPLRRLVEIAAAAPFGNGGATNGGTLYVGFLKDPANAVMGGALEDLRSDTDDFVLQDRELYWLCRTRFSDSPVSGGMLEKTLATSLTIRNANTLQRMVEKFTAA